MAIFVIHGVAAAVDPHRFAYRNLIECDALGRFLGSRPPLVSLANALAGHGDALTIDDATRAGADAALLVRERGQPVTLFVNPGQVESGAPYSFVALNAVLDDLDGVPRTLGGQSFPVSSISDRQALRRAVKDALGDVRDEPGRLAYVLERAKEWMLAPPTIPGHFQTLRRDDLRSLHAAGVDLQNHGWSHVSHASLSAADSLQEVRAGREWLKHELGIEAPCFAVPFGDVLPRDGAEAACDVWFTSTITMPYGTDPGSLVFNREELDARSPGPAPANESRGHAARVWIARLTRRS